MAEPVTIDLRHVARGLGIPLRQVEAVVELLDDGNTVPFITRYRKDATGSLDEDQIRQIQSRLKKLRLLAERKETILRSIESQGKLTDKLARQILAASTTKRLEDLYLPFKPKKQTLATLARSRGLEPLAQEILNAAVSREDLDKRAADFINPDRQVPTAAAALLGAGHILTEWFSEQAELRHRLREILQRTGKLVSRPAVESKPQGESADEKAGKSPGDAAPATVSVFSADAAAQGAVEKTEGTEGSLGEAVATGWAVMPEDAVISYDTAGWSPETAPSGDRAPDSPASVPPLTSAVGPEPIACLGGPLDPAAISLAEKPEAAEVSSLGTDSPGVETRIAAESAETPTPTPPPAPLTAAEKRKRAKAELQRLKKEKKKKQEERKQKAFRDYFDYSEELRKIPPHRILAINRGERCRVLRVRIESDQEAMERVVDELCVPPDHPHADFLRGCARDALVRLILPSLEREARRELTERAEAHAVQVFARNLRNLLLVSPVRDRRILAVDPGYKSGCKMVAIDQFGNVLGHQTIFLVGKAERVEQARRVVVEMVEQHDLSVVAIGNGTACRQAEEFFADLIEKELKDKGLSYVIVNEAGASVYSTSPLGREEFPQYDASVRVAISIGRRLQDPLSELVKIDPPNLGVGLYQHDLKANHLRESLEEVVESCVNYVGVDVNTASPSLLRYVSGLNQLTARRIYEYRLEHGPFRNREQLKEVPGIGEATFVQAAGFLKILGGDNPLDATWIHPESYPIAARVMERLGISPADLFSSQNAASLAERIRKVDTAALAAELQVGSMLLNDILSQLARPGRDPREDLPAPVFKRGVLKLEDLSPGMELTGTVLNVVDFGAFVDIGMHDSGLVHVSQLADKFIRDPHEFVAVGDIVRVWVIDVDKTRRRVSLTMIPPGRARPGPQRHETPQGPLKPEGKREAERGPKPPRPAGQSRPEIRSTQPSSGRADRPRFQHRPPRSADRTADRPPPRPKPITPLTDEMKSGKEPLRSFSDLMQFYGLGQPSGGGETGRGKKKSDDRRVKQAPRRKDQTPDSTAAPPSDPAQQSTPSAPSETPASAESPSPGLETVPNEIPPAVPPTNESAAEDIAPSGSSGENLSPDLSPEDKNDSSR
jgi:uncharacterized protein